MTSNRYLRQDLDELPDYTPVHVPDPRRIIKLDSNENQYGPSPRVIAALADIETWHYYFGQDELRDELAAYAGVSGENIVITNGGDEAIDLVLRAVLEPGESVIDAPPSFEMYRISTLANRGRVLEIPRRRDLTLDLDRVCRAVSAENVRAIVLASPNNPDGGLLAREDLLSLVRLPTLVVLDEAYIEFAGSSAVDLVSNFPNLVLVRTFSKWAGLAGLRVGYVIASSEFSMGLHKLRAPYNVNLAALVAAHESLLDKDYLLQNVSKTIEERERMRRELARLGWLEPMPSYTNFLLLRVHGRAPHDVRAELARQGILIRAFKSPRLAEYIRISIGKPEQNEAVLSALRGLNDSIRL